MPTRTRSLTQCTAITLALAGGLALIGRAAAAEPDVRQAAADHFAPAVATLRERAHAALKQRPVSVMDKSQLPPSGDRHDFLTLSPYYWPQADTDDGLPYQFRDGELNPESSSDKYDRVRYFEMGRNATALALAYRMIGDEEYARHAARWLRVWFLEPATRMNPNLQYAQLVPGREGGNQTGIIRGTLVIELIEAAHWLDASPHWTDDDRREWIAWQREFLAWLTGSALGQAESHAFNNHGTWYDALVATLAIECSDEKVTRGVLEAAPRRRITPQIAADGRQPFELLRTKSWGYSVFNLEAMFHLARLAKPLGLDLWHWKSDKSAGLRGAVDYLVPYATGDARWQRQQIRQFEADALAPLLWQAAEAYAEPRYAAAAGSIPGFDPRESVELLKLPDAVLIEMAEKLTP